LNLLLYSPVLQKDHINSGKGKKGKKGEKGDTWGK